MTFSVTVTTGVFDPAGPTIENVFIFMPVVSLSSTEAGAGRMVISAGVVKAAPIPDGGTGAKKMVPLPLSERPRLAPLGELVTIIV